MTRLKIVKFPDARLCQTCQPVSNFDSKELSQQITDMIETMYAEKGVGLAASQVGIPLRIFVMDVSQKGDEAIVAINPKIIHQEGEQIDQHGCLSVGHGIGDKIKRSAKVHMIAQDQAGNPFELTAEGTTAICIQHEIDHLNGKLFIDYLSRLKFDRICKKIEKYQRMLAKK